MNLEKNQKKARLIGICLVLLGAVLWGISGTVGQYLFEQQAFNAEWLTVIRLLSAGVVLLCLAIIGGNKKIWSIWTTRSNQVNLVCEGIFIFKCEIN